MTSGRTTRGFDKAFGQAYADLPPLKRESYELRGERYSTALGIVYAAFPANKRQRVTPARVSACEPHDKLARESAKYHMDVTASMHRLAALNVHTSVEFDAGIRRIKSALRSDTMDAAVLSEIKTDSLNQHNNAAKTDGLLYQTCLALSPSNCHQTGKYSITTCISR